MLETSLKHLSPWSVEKVSSTKLVLGVKKVVDHWYMMPVEVAASCYLASLSSPDMAYIHKS